MGVEGSTQPVILSGARNPGIALRPLLCLSFRPRTNYEFCSSNIEGKMITSADLSTEDILATHLIAPETSSHAPQTAPDTGTALHDWHPDKESAVHSEDSAAAGTSSPCR
jgi:hypothetical protein